MIHLRRHTLLLLFLLLCALPTAPGTARAADTCTADRLKAAKVTTAAEFVHRGGDVSRVTSVTDITVPAVWGHASDLFLDTRAPDYRAALRCLLGRESGFYDYEWRLKPLTVKRDEDGIAVHYEAEAWVQGLDTYEVGFWTLTARESGWTVRLRSPASLASATWADVRVRLGGPAAMSASPAHSGEGHTELIWDEVKAGDLPVVAFQPPAAQQWAAVAQTRGPFWEALGIGGASGAFGAFATGVLVFVAGKRLRGGLGRHPVPEEEKALRGLRSWALILVFLSLLVYLGDDFYRFLQQNLSWEENYEPTLCLFLVLLIGLVLCVFGKLRAYLLTAVCALAVGMAALYAIAEVSHSGVFSTSDIEISRLGARLAVLFYAVPVFVYCLGVIASGQRLLLTGGRRLPQWVMVCAAAGLSGLALLWAFLAFDRSWERRTWLADPASSEYEAKWLTTYDAWWWWFASNILPTLMNIAIQLTPLAMVGVLRVCRAERHEADSFTPSKAEGLFLVIFFAAVVVPNYASYFGFSGYIATVVLALLAAWALLAFGQSKAVLEKPTAGNAPLGKAISRNDRSEWLRLAHRYRELQSGLHHLGTGSSAERSASQEAIEQEIDRLDGCLPEGVRPIDLPFAFGPMPTWWGNACRCALIACFIGLPATALMYWIDVVRGVSWGLTTENIGGLLTAAYEILYWQVTWMSGGFFLGALWRDLPGRHGPMKALSVAAAFAVPVGVHEIIAQMTGQGLQNTVSAIAAFASVMTLSGLIMDVQTFKSERRYRSSNASLLVNIYQMRMASVALLLAQLVALAAIWKGFHEGGPVSPTDTPPKKGP
ncbi:DUF6185 family protein [Streptomyces sp. NBC_01343]|uniref:DUF6185 family protein n=1 Tax=Streptomyces sp. NBC_01343 TaxID=2903832 RepID=UPI002E13D78F|nr:DUF6185 family protein [Streptomyces sp. NBC_01343]